MTWYEIATMEFIVHSLEQTSRLPVSLDMQCSTGNHCVFYHRYNIVWSTKYRYKVLCGDFRLRVQDICRHVCREKDVDINSGGLFAEHVHMFVFLPPKLAVNDLVRLMEGHLSHKVQREFPRLKKRYWGKRFWG